MRLRKPLAPPGPVGLPRARGPHPGRRRAAARGARRPRPVALPRRVARGVCPAHRARRVAHHLALPPRPRRRPRRRDGPRHPRRRPPLPPPRTLLPRPPPPHHAPPRARPRLRPRPELRRVGLRRRGQPPLPRGVRRHPPQLPALRAALARDAPRAALRAAPSPPRRARRLSRGAPLGAGPRGLLRRAVRPLGQRRRAHPLRRGRGVVPPARAECDVLRALRGVCTPHLSPELRP